MTALPRLRPGIDIIPCTAGGRKLFLLRDRYDYSPDLFVPMQLGPVLLCFDGQHDRAALKRAMSRQLGRPAIEADIDGFLIPLVENGALEGEEFDLLREQKHTEFARAETREAKHAGSGYPEVIAEIDQTFDGYYQSAKAERAAAVALSRIGIAAPHVSPWGGPEAYASAYAKIAREHADKTFVILGTSHYGEPDRFGLTKKAYSTPYGRAEVDHAAVDYLIARAPDAITQEDYCHSIEHSIEFQVVFLQHAVKRPIKILPILCGPFFCAPGKKPEDQPRVAAFLSALRSLAAEKNNDLFWVLGIDLAHMGQRYGDNFDAETERGPMAEVEKRDRARLERVFAGDADQFFQMAHSARDDLKWCGTTPLYTFMRAVPGVRGELLRYQQWNIDPQSVVTFAGLEFVR